MALPFDLLLQLANDLHPVPLGKSCLKLAQRRQQRVGCFRCDVPRFGQRRNGDRTVLINPLKFDRFGGVHELGDRPCGTRDGRVLSRSSPSTPACMNRSCQRHTQVLLLTVRRMISTVPRPSAVNRMIVARQTCFCGLLRLAATASRRARSAALASTTTCLRMPQTRTRREPGESSFGFFRQVLSTS